MSAVPLNNISFQGNINIYLYPIATKACESFICSGTLTLAVTLSPSLAIMSGTVGAVATIVGHLANAALTKMGADKFFDSAEKKAGFKTIILTLTHSVLTGGATTVQQIAIFAITSLGLAKGGRLFQNEANEPGYVSLMV